MVSDPYIDPKENDPKLAVVDVKVKERLKSPLTLSQFKSDAFFADFLLVNNARLSVMPVSEKQWQRICR